MKLKLIPMLAGVLAAAAIAVTPLVAVAQAPQSEATRTRITLSDEQHTQLEQIQAETISQIQSVLTKEQNTQLMASLQNGQGLNGVENLSDEQLTQIQTILQQFNERIGGILTPEQIQQIEQGQPSQ
ncbi:MAG TPA: hypothetical protein V6C95_10800 [Coleofasciculaceae cyanobacterium]